MKSIIRPLTRPRYLASGVALFLLGSSLVVFAESISVADDSGISVSFNKPPERVISLPPSLTESMKSPC